MNLFFIGCGNCADIVVKKMYDKINKLYIYDTNTETSKSFIKKHPKSIVCNPSILDTIDVDFVIETACIEAVKKYTETILNFNKNFIIISSGAFSDELFFIKTNEQLKKSKSNIYIPSGAIGGIDIINSIYENISKITLTTRKTAKSLNKDIISEKIIFSGSVREAIKKYPKNINVAVTLALANKNFENVYVKIIADPNINKNIHNINIESSVGRYNFSIENEPSSNPKTSLLAPLSIVGFLKKYDKKIKIGV